MTASDKDFEDFARECVRLANAASDPKIRDRLMEMAREWLASAMHEETVRQLSRSRRKSPRSAL